MSRINPTSTLRSGFDYQTVWAIKIIADWLKNPELFNWIQFETVPNEINSSKFYLDDVIACDLEGNYQFYQLKYKQHPSNPKEFWTFEKFLEKATDKGTSLFKKWSLSISNDKLSGKIRKAVLVTNGHPDEYFNRFLQDGQIDILRLKQENGPLFSLICSEIGSEKKAIEFFSKFYFFISQPSLDELEINIRTLLTNELKVTYNGCTSLFYNINKISRSQFPIQLDIGKIREFCEFDDPRPLNQEFLIPSDFEFFDTYRHSEIITDLASIRGGVKIIYGKPGVGKSTYLSKLSQKLKETGYFVIKHQYFISASDPDASERLLPYRVIEALKAKFKEAPEYLGILAKQNSAELPLQEFLKQASVACAESGKPCILIIDGLDHVVRFKDQEALKDLLKEICVPEKGLWLIFGTQESAFDYIPLDILSRCSTKDRVELTGLTHYAIDNIINRNECELNLPQNDFQIRELSDKIFTLTEGNPLILRFTLRELKNKFARRMITAYDCADILPYSGNIQTYYEQLWQKIGNESKTLLISVSSVSFKFSKVQLTNFLTFCFLDPSKVSSAFKSILHILGEQDDKYSIFHASFGLFITKQIEFQEQEQAIKQKIIDWLQTSEYEELKWGEEKKLFYDLGNSTPILSIDEQWVFNALCYPRETRQIISQLSIANEAAFKEKKFGLALKFSKLHDYLLESSQYSDEIRLLWNESIKQGNRNFDEILIDDLSPSQLYHYCCELDDSGLFSIYFQRIKKRFNKLLKNLEIQTKSESFNTLPELPIYLIRVMAINRTYPLGNVEEFIEYFDKYGWGDDLFIAYIKELLMTEQYLKIEEIYTKSLSEPKQYKLLVQLAKNDLLKDCSNFFSKIKSIDQSELPLPCLLYLYLRDCEIIASLKLPDEKSLEVFSTEYGILFEENEAERYINIFYVSLLFCLLDRNEELTSWIDNHKLNTNWNIDVTTRLFHISINLSEKMKKHEEIQISEIFCNLYDLHQPRYERFTTNSGLMHAIHSVAKEILTVTCILKIKIQQNLEISQDDLNRIQFNPWINRENFLGWLLEFKKPIIGEFAFSEYVVNELEFWRHNIVPFSERAQHYIKLATLCRYHGDRRYNQILKLGARNLVTYGYHKDMFLDTVIESIRTCYHKQFYQVGQWIQELEKPVEFISEYTDGDETRHFPMNFANLLGNINSQFLFKHYFTAIKNEEFDQAEKFFADILSILDYDKEINVSIASTALDIHSFKVIHSLSENGNLKANYAKKSIEDHFGQIIFPKEDSTIPSTLPQDLVPNYDHISFDKLAEHIRSFDGTWEADKYLNGWITHQLSQSTPNYKTIYETIINIVDNSPAQSFYRDTLDSLYPLAYLFDPEKAFQYVTIAQASSLGWFEYWSDEDAARRRWQFIKEHYPKRYLEFFEKSIILMGENRSYPYGYSVPLPRSLNYFILFNRLDIVEDIAKKSIDTIKLLMADIEFPTVEWTQYPDVDEFDILLSRLKWPSPLVRERAAMEIARLLCDKSIREPVFMKLTEWIQQQTLESIVAVGLLPIIKSAEMDSQIKTWLKINTVTNCLPISSIIIDKLILDLSSILEQPFEVQAKRMAISELPDGYKIPENFGQDIRQFLSPAYWENAKELSDETGFNFVGNWAATSDELKNELHISYNVQNIGFYHGYQHQPQLLAMSSNMSEIYRSAYLRVFDHCYRVGLLTDYDLNSIYTTMPIDISLWNVKIGRCPPWWPQINFSEEITEENIDKLNIKVISNIKQFYKEQDVFKILAIEGAIKPFSGWNGKVTSTIKLVGFSYANCNEGDFDETQFAQYILNRHPFSVISPLEIKPFRFLESNQHIEINSPLFIWHRKIIGSHLIDNFYLSQYCLWQWYRFRMGLPIGLSSELSMNTSIKIQDGHWRYYQGKSLIAECHDWLEGLYERVSEGAIIPYGRYIQIDPSFLKDYLDNNESHIKYAVEISHDIRKYPHEEPKILKNYKIITIDG